MDNIERRDRQILYISDDAVFEVMFPPIRKRWSICAGCGRKATIRSGILRAAIDILSTGGGKLL